MKTLVHDLVDLVFPDPCPGCNRPLVTGEGRLCSSCELALPVFAHSENINDRFAGRLPLQGARAFLKFYHGGMAQKLLHAIKYKGNTKLAVYLGGLFARHLRPANPWATVELVVPIPLHKSKLRSRGYNQSTFLAQGIAAHLGASLDATTVVRAQKSATQTKKDRAERWHNVSGIFSVTGQALKGKHVLLVDDVITTGATLEACGAALLAAGVASLRVAALAAAM